MSQPGLLIPGWIYNLADYCQIFDLSEEDRCKRILDFPGGISSFNAEMQAAGHAAVSGDPHYYLDPHEMSRLAEEILAMNETNLRTNSDQLKKSDEYALKQIFQHWQENKKAFLSDYARGQRERRYLEMSLPRLPYDDFHFELVLCSDLLFHAHARGGLSPAALLAELARVAHEVRIFPILDEKNQMPSDIGPLMLEYQKQNFGIELREVPYEIKKGGNAMLRIWNKLCRVPCD